MWPLGWCCEEEEDEDAAITRCLSSSAKSSAAARLRIGCFLSKSLNRVGSTRGQPGGRLTSVSGGPFHWTPRLTAKHLSRRSMDSRTLMTSYKRRRTCVGRGRRICQQRSACTRVCGGSIIKKGESGHIGAYRLVVARLDAGAQLLGRLLEADRRRLIVNRALAQQ